MINEVGKGSRQSGFRPHPSPLPTCGRQASKEKGLMDGKEAINSLLTRS